MTYVVRTRILHSATALAMLTLSACLSESRRFPTEPPPPVAYQPSFVSVSLKGANGMVSNKVKYSDSGLRPVRGRVGSTNVEARALLGPNGVALVEVTTGTFEGGPDLSRIDKVQLKIVNSARTPINERPQARYWSKQVSGVTTSDVMEITVHVRLSSTSGSQVATLLVPVTLPPDLEVVDIQGLSQAYVNTPVTLIATVRERNGNWGARANCLLKVDGVGVDQATGIWVDKNGVVNCQFTHFFRTIGLHSVEVSLTGITPTDLNTSNNSASMNVSVVPLGNPIAFGAITVVEEDYMYRYESVRTGDYPINALNEGTQARTELTYDSQDAPDFPGPAVRVDANISVAGQTVHESTLNEFASYEYDNGVAMVKCVDYFTSGEQANVCTSTFRDNTVKTTFHYFQSSGTVTYYSTSIVCTVWGCNSRTQPRDSTVTGSGRLYGLSAGSEVRVQLTFVDQAGEAWIVDRNVLMADASDEVNRQSSGCSPYWDGGGDLCFNNVESGVLLRGRTIW